MSNQCAVGPPIDSGATYGNYVDHRSSAIATPIQRQLSSQSPSLSPQSLSSLLYSITNTSASFFTVHSIPTRDILFTNPASLSFSLFPSLVRNLTLLCRRWLLPLMLLVLLLHARYHRTAPLWYKRLAERSSLYTTIYLCLD